MVTQAADTTVNKSVDILDDNSYTDEELALLSKDEREAILGMIEEDNPDKKDDDKDEPDSNDEKDDEKDDESDSDDSEDEEQDDDKDSDDEVVDADVDKQDEVQNKEPLKIVEAKTPVYQPTVNVTEYSDEEYKTDVQAVVELFESGDMETVDKEIALSKLAHQKYQADTSPALAQQASNDVWEADKRAFFAANSIFETNSAANGALTAAVRDLDATDEGKEMSGAVLLQRAAKVALEQMQSLINPVKEPAKELEPEEKQRPRLKKSDKKSPDSLSDIPAAEDNTEKVSLFDSLDLLDGQELEDAVASLSVADKKRYEQML